METGRFDTTEITHKNYTSTESCMIRNDMKL